MATNTPSQRSLLSAQQPLFYAVLALGAGILLAERVWLRASWWIAAAVVFILSAVLFAVRRRAVALTCALLAFGALGALNFQLRQKPAVSNPAIAELSDGSEVVLTGYVIRDGVFRAAMPHRQTIDLETQTVEREGNVIAVRAGVRLNIYQRAPEPEDDSDETQAGSAPVSTRQFVYGERLRIRTKLRLPRNFGNPGAFDYRGYLASQGIEALGSARTDRVEMLPGRSGTFAGRWRSQVRQSLLERIGTLWPADDAALIAAMLLGDRTGIERETTLNYQRTGTYHILVVSGLTIGVLAFPMLWLLRRVGLGDGLATFITVGATGTYAYITDGGAPVWRATLMLVFYLLMRLLYRGRAPLNAIGAAGLIMLLADPQALFDASFQLTFLAIVAIAGIALPLVERTSLPYRRALRHFDSRNYDLALAPRLAQFRLDLRLIAEKLAVFFGKHFANLLPRLSARSLLYAYDIVVVSALIQVVLALPMAIYFHRAVALGLPANSLIVPAQAFLVPPAALAIVLSYVSTALAKVPALVAETALLWTNAVVEWMSQASLGGANLGDIRIPNPEFTWSLIGAAAIGLALMLMRKRVKFVAAGVLALLLSAAAISFVLPTPKARPGVLEITAIDVGQGDSLLVITPQGKSLLIDAGGALGPVASDFDYGEQVVSTYLWSRGISRLDVVALTHAHADHIGGLRSVMRNFRPRELWLGPNPQIEIVQNLLAEANAHNVRVIPRRKGELIELGGADFRVLAPPVDWQTAERPRNNDSLVLLVTHGSTSALLAGDAEKKIERMLIETPLPPIGLMKIAHHGSATSTSPELLEAVDPEYAVISVGYRSHFGHPRKEVLGRLQAAKVKTFRTDLMGAVTFYLDGTQVTHTTFAEQQR